MSVIIVAIYKFYLLIHMEAITMNQLKFVPTSNLQHQSNVSIGHIVVSAMQIYSFSKENIFSTNMLKTYSN